MSPNKTIGILGGGQLAKMLAIAAAELGFNISIYCPDRDCPAAQVASKVIFGNYDDSDTVSYTHLRCRRIERCRSRWSPYH